MQNRIVGLAFALALCVVVLGQGADVQPPGKGPGQVEKAAADPGTKKTAAREPLKGPIRVGIIRCDLHAIYYAALMDKHDPLLLRGPQRVSRRMRRRHTWLSGAAHFYHYTNYARPWKMTAPRVEGFRVTKLWDRNREVAEIASKIFYGKPKVCDSFEEVSDDVDMVFIADCNGSGGDHLRLATPGIKKGVPTFIDKPLAYDVKDAVAIVELAKKHETPILSLSILRTLPHAATFKKRFDEVEEVHFATINGGGFLMAGYIHTISLAQHLFGTGVESVQVMGNRRLGHVFLDYGDKPGRPARGVVLNCDRGPGPHCAFYVSVYGPAGAAHSAPFTDYEFPWGAAENLKLAKRMVETREPPVPYDDMIENIAVAAAARLAQKERRPVRIDEVWKR